MQHLSRRHTLKQRIGVILIATSVVVSSLVALGFSAPEASAGSPDFAVTETIEAADHVEDSLLAGGANVNDNAVDFTSLGGSFDQGDYIALGEVDFGDGGCSQAMAYLAVPQDSAGKSVMIKADDPISEEAVAEIVLNATGDPPAFKEHYAALSDLTGKREVFLYFPQAMELDVDWVTFTGYDGEPDSPEENAARMAWWSQARYGQFIHWGGYSHLGGFWPGDPEPDISSEWIYHNQIFFKNKDITKDDYAEAIRGFNPTEWDPAKVAKLAKDAGQQYVVITSKHHEGYSMYDTKVRDFRDFKLQGFGPYEGDDPLAGLAEAVRAEGLHFGFYFSIMDWHDASQYIVPWTSEMVDSPRPGTPEYEGSAVYDDFISRMKGQLRELVEIYDPEVFFFDGETPEWWTEDAGRELYRYMRSLKPSLVINNRIGKKHGLNVGDYETPEQEIPADGPAVPWETCMTLNGNWGYHSGDQGWKSPQEVVATLVRAASGGGNLLLNVGPDDKGAVPQASQDILTEAGQWLAANGESIYGTQRSPFISLPDGVRATSKEGKVYLHLFEHTGSTLTIPELKNEIVGVKTLQDDADLSYEVLSDGQISIDLTGVERDSYDTVIEISVEGTPEGGAYTAPDAALRTLYEEASAYYDMIKGDKELYTVSSFNAFENALAEAAAVLDNPDTTLDDVNASLATLQAAMDGMILRMTDEELEILNMVIEGAEKFKESDYTKASWEPFANALDAAKSIAGTPTEYSGRQSFAAANAVFAAQINLERLGGHLDDDCPYLGQSSPPAVAIDLSPVKVTVSDKVWTGKKIMSGFDVRVNGKKLTTGTDYAVTKTGANKNVGKGSVWITGRGNYKNSVKVEFDIVPKAVKIKSLKARAKSFAIKWAKAPKAEKITKYQVRWKVKGAKKWSKAKAVSPKKASLIVKNLKKGKRYDVQMRAYRTVKGAKYYSAWSKARSVRVN